MTRRIGITGHQQLQQRLEEAGILRPEDDAWQWVEATFRDFLHGLETSDLIVISSLAAGADQRLSRLAWQAGAKLNVIIPAKGYQETFASIQEQQEFQELLDQAHEVIELENDQPSEEAFFEAGKRMVDLADTIVAVWDGQDAVGLGGTGDVVRHARQTGKSVISIDPIHQVVTMNNGG